MIPSPELQSKIATWRARAAAGEMSQQDWKDCVADLRRSRAAATAAAKSRKSAKAPIDVGALKDSLKAFKKS